MTTEEMEGKSLDRYGRLTGLLYVLILILSASGSRLADGFHVRGDFAQTAANVQGAELLYRLGLSMELTAAALVILLGGTTFAMLRVVNRNLALIALLWRVGEATLGAVFVVCSFIALNVYTGAAAAFPLEQQEVLSQLFRSGTRTAFSFATLYFSFGSILFFYLLLQSRFIPPALAALGLLASVSVTLLGYGFMLVPAQTYALGYVVWLPIMLTELATGIWLLVRGVNLESWRARSIGGRQGE